MKVILAIVVGVLIAVFGWPALVMVPSILGLVLIAKGEIRCE